ncbi:MAG: dinitrogenase iron-molybdenum cofactor [Clostridia bacterium]|nr:NifB/NifX family molybdenum-iron cluster-binding protein [Eubacteriales bacterium]MDD3867074.1 NifB/NifX family molybdenum-iron cluster-binding protein [Eubacteriales bacterium]MDD4461248.1 NifB/NifX family molybdenum-iron cluster-binding protein [Eubacteriales bacterium]NCC48615.1 dinitrogenase iron-molybdenum cofactor [Clostridia bacterium]
MTRIAIATQGKHVSPHFGHCDGFTLADIEQGTVRNRSFLPSPPHQPGLLPVLLSEHNVNTVIAGGMGSGAIELFRERDISVMTGVKDSVENTLAAYAEGRLESSGEECSDHHFSDACHHD